MKKLLSFISALIGILNLFVGTGILVFVLLGVYGSDTYAAYQVGIAVANLLRGSIFRYISLLNFSTTPRIKIILMDICFLFIVTSLPSAITHMLNVYPYELSMFMGYILFIIFGISFEYLKRQYNAYSETKTKLYITPFVYVCFVISSYIPAISHILGIAGQRTPIDIVMNFITLAISFCIIYFDLKRIKQYSEFIIEKE